MGLILLFEHQKSFPQTGKLVYSDRLETVIIMNVLFPDHLFILKKGISYLKSILLFTIMAMI